MPTDKSQDDVDRLDDILGRLNGLLYDTSLTSLEARRIVRPSNTSNGDFTSKNLDMHKPGPIVRTTSSESIASDKSDQTRHILCEGKKAGVSKDELQGYVSQAARAKLDYFDAREGVGASLRSAVEYHESSKKSARKARKADGVAAAIGGANGALQFVSPAAGIAAPVPFLTGLALGAGKLAAGYNAAVNKEDQNKYDESARREITAAERYLREMEEAQREFEQNPLSDGNFGRRSGGRG